MIKSFYLFVFSLLWLNTGLLGQTASAPAAGAGTLADPWQISSLENLYWITATDAIVPSPTDATRRAAHYIQTANIDASATAGWAGAKFPPIGRPNAFSGRYNGAGYIIDGLNVAITNNFAGLFGFISGSVIQNLGLVNAVISGTSYVGGLIGNASSTNTISNCYFIGTVTASSDWVGGLVGYNNDNNVITNCFSMGSVTGAGSGVGGLVGYNNTSSIIQRSFSTATVVGTKSSDDWVGGLVGVVNSSSTVNNSYATGSVNGYNRVGGLIGYLVNTTAAVNSYAAGKVTAVGAKGGLMGTGSAVNSFWDNQTSGFGGTSSRTTAGMKTDTTYTNNTWDFVVEVTNGTNNYWARDDTKNGGYPYLSWQTFPYSVTLTNGTAYSPSITNGQTNQALGRFALSTNSLGAYFNTVWIKLNGTRTGATNFKLWESSDNAFDAGSDTQIGTTVSADPGTGGTIWFLSLNKKLAVTDKYYFLTADIASNATGSIEPVLENDASMMLGLASLSSSPSNTPMSSGNSPLPVELTSFSAELLSNSVLLKWKTATEVMNYGFEVHKIAAVDYVSEGGTTVSESGWSVLGFIAGHGTSNSPKEYMFTDRNAAGGRYLYRLKQIDNDGSFTYSQTTEADISNIRGTFALNQNYPNPFNPGTEISFSLPQQAHTSLVVYDIMGKEVKVLLNSVLTAGVHNIYFDGAALSAGVYIYRLVSGGLSITKQCIFLK